MTPKPDAIWEHFYRFKDDGKQHPKVVCKYCNGTWVSKSTERAREHGRSCNNFPPGIVEGQPSASKAATKKPPPISTADTMTETSQVVKRSTQKTNDPYEVIKTGTHVRVPVPTKANFKNARGAAMILQSLTNYTNQLAQTIIKGNKQALERTGRSEVFHICDDDKDEDSSKESEDADGEMEETEHN